MGDAVTSWYVSSGTASLARGTKEQHRREEGAPQTPQCHTFKICNNHTEVWWQKRRLYIFNFMKLYVLEHRREEDAQTPNTIHAKGVTTTLKFGSKREDYLQPYQSLVAKEEIKYIYL